MRKRKTGVATSVVANQIERSRESEPHSHPSTESVSFISGVHPMNRRKPRLELHEAGTT
jgi:hypothetical protein